MFEDSTFESGKRIKTKSGRWMLVTGILNGSVILLLILIPLIYPEALPKQMLSAVLSFTPPPPPPPPPPPQVKIVHVQAQMMNNQLMAPSKIPKNIDMVTQKEAPPSDYGVAGMEGLGGSAVGAFGNAFGSGPAVKVATPKKISISGGVEAGLLIQRTMPVYPPIAKAARVQGTVVLQATISKEGRITDLHVISGPAMLQQSAMEAVRNWRYRPYLLNGEPVEVETTINVIYTLGD